MRPASMLRKLLLVFALCLASAPAWAAVAFDSKNTVACNGTGTSPETLTCTSTKSPTVGSGSNRALAVMALWVSSGGNPTVTGTWNGTSLGTILGTSAFSGGQSGGTGIFCLANPASGNNTLTITATGTGVAELHAISMSVTGADQTTPCQNYQGIGDQASSSTPTVTVTSATGDIAFGMVANNATFFTSCGPTQLLFDTTGPNFGYGGSYGAGASTVAISCTLSGGPAVNQLSGADFKAAGGGGGSNHNPIVIDEWSAFAP